MQNDYPDFHHIVCVIEALSIIEIKEMFLIIFPLWFVYLFMNKQKPDCSIYISNYKLQGIII